MTTYKEAKQKCEELAQQYIVRLKDKNGGLSSVFSSETNVSIIHEEGTELFYRYAIVHKWKEWFLILTEHHGNHVYHEDDLYDISYWSRKQIPEFKMDQLGRSN